MILDFITILSLALTIAFVGNALRTCLIWKNSFLEGMRKPWKDRTESDWLAEGIFVGFATNIVDNIFWAIVWILVLFDNKYAPAFFAAGAVINVIFRQFLGTVAARTHVIAANLLHHGQPIDHQDFRWATIIGFILLSCAYLWHANTAESLETVSPPQDMKQCLAMFSPLNHQEESIIRAMCKTYWETDGT